MSNYSKLGYKSLENYSQYFLDSLLETNRTYDFFIDWDKVFSKLENYLIEINILNSLTKISSTSISEKFIEILKKYPECVPVLPMILAIRDKKIGILDADDKTFKNIDFSKRYFKMDEIIKFSKKTGLLNLFSEINDLYSYLTGTEVGLDTNARKNRSGHIFEKLVGDTLNETIKDKEEYKLVAEDKNIKLRRNKRFDHVIYKNNILKFVFECNFYNSTGSKPIEVAHAYIDLQDSISNSGMTFIWITDGLGWRKMFTTLKPALNKIDYIFNYNIFRDNIEKILFENK
ncbi:MAG: type II restriction endonuclease [Methanobrevibacter sp.]|jgi:type II restriction enzyme|nr:type II restriction endonuclease [Candidatus Methanovirga australis]